MTLIRGWKTTQPAAVIHPAGKVRSLRNTSGSSSTATGYQALFSNMGLTTGRKRNYKYESVHSAQNDSLIPQKSGQSLLSISFYFVFRT
jgi:hypothetical protein